METYDPHKNTTEVSQANRRTTSFRVLVISIIIIVVAFALIWGVYALWPQGNVIS